MICRATQASSRFVYVYAHTVVLGTTCFVTIFARMMSKVMMTLDVMADDHTVPAFFLLVGS